MITTLIIMFLLLMVTVCFMAFFSIFIELMSCQGVIITFIIIIGLYCYEYKIIRQLCEQQGKIITFYRISNGENNGKRK